MNFLVAVQLLTSFPVAVKQKLGPERLGKATAWFPVVGLLMGLVLAGVNWLLAWVLPPLLIDAILVTAMVLMTGAMHLDGLADTCDGTAGYRDKADRLRIMHDSRTGAFGVVGIVVVLLLKFAAIGAIQPRYVNAALILMPVLSRWAMVYAIYAFKYATPEGMGAAYKQATRLPELLSATIVALGVAAVLIPILSLVGFAAFAGVGLATTVMALYLRGKLGGLTGDTYGAINEVMEVMTMVFIAVIL